MANGGVILQKPGVMSSYGNGWRQLWKYFLELFLIMLITMIVGLPSIAGQINEEGVIFLVSAFLAIYALLVQGPISYGASYAYLRAARGDKLEITDMFASFCNYSNAVLANLLVGVIVCFGFILLIVPGIIFACKLAFTPYLVVDRKMEVIAAVKESWRLTNGHAMEVFLIGLLAIPIFIAGLLVLGVGVFISIMWVSLALASLYHTVTSSATPPAEGQA